ncbi:MAG: iron-sulfur cluster assembly accessory protein [Polyangiaceae bacterium]|jgi:iron-sulfur cluster assembly protein
MTATSTTQQRAPEGDAAARPSAAVTVTPNAVDAIARQMRKRGTLEAGLRLGVRGGGCSGFSYVIEFFDGAPHARDRVFEFAASDGTPVRVIVDPKSLLYLSGTVLDWEQSLMRQGFKFSNPNATGGCGCGSSFTV